MRTTPPPGQPREARPAGPPDGAFGATSAPAVVRGGLWTLLNRTLPQVQILALSVITARYLGPSDMGRQSYIAFVALALVQAATAGLPTSLARFVGELLGARAGGQAMDLYRLTRRVERVAACLVLATLLAVAALGGAPAGAWVLAGLSGGLAVLQPVPNAILIGAQQWRQASTPGLTTGVATVPLAVLVLEAGGENTGPFAGGAAPVVVEPLLTTAPAPGGAARLPPPHPARPPP